MLAYFHPFVDGNGRTARSLFYWYMLKKGYWLVEYMSISRTIYKTKGTMKKPTSIQNMTTTIWLISSYTICGRWRRPLKNWRYTKRKSEENSSIVLIANIKGINTRQAQILKIIHEQPNTCLSVKEVENRFSVSNFTARTDLEGLVGLGYLSELQINKVKRNYIKSDKFDSLMKNKL